VVLTASNGVSYKWFKDGILIPGAATSVLNANGPGLYHVIVSNGTCEGYSSNKVEVKFQECMPVAEPKVVVPTAFSPNNNNANDLLRPLLYNIDQLNYFKVYNRWGQLVFQTQTKGAGWDGKINGQLQPTETYTWIVECVDRDGKVIRQSGRTILIR
ncbi:MAG: T9SS type B sorting domain-containing protein, partial [Chitinophagaceae bacterium]